MEKITEKTFIIILLLILASCGQTGKAPVSNYLNYDRDLHKLLEEKGLDASKIQIRIDKSDFKLSLIHGESVIKEFPMVLGGNPVDDKLREGDKCTPEGHFKVRDMYPHRSWSKFIWIDYPTKESWKKHKAAKAAGKIPDSSHIGGEIGIHGVPSGRDDLIQKKTNWTLGCISLSTDDINEIYSVCFKGMDVFIQK
ncbi:MAG: L,D-transpeptidase family protein [Bacteroidota bacterium]